MYLVIDEMCPEKCHGAVVGIGRQEGWSVEGLVDVLEDDKGLADRAVPVPFLWMGLRVSSSSLLFSRSSRMSS